jgi:hypothetical protein
MAVSKFGGASAKGTGGWLGEGIGGSGKLPAKSAYDPATIIKAAGQAVGQAVNQPASGSLMSKAGLGSYGAIPSSVASPASLGLGTNPDAPKPPGGNNNGGGNASANAAAMAAAAQAALDAKYAGIEGRVNTTMADNQSAYTAAQERMKGFYGEAAKDRTEPYATGMSELSGNLANLGMDFSQSDVAKDWDKNERNLQENADLALANDNSWFEKMKVVNKDIYDQMLMELAQAKLAEQTGGGSGGGGGGGRGGRGGRGGGGSGGGDKKLTGDIQADEDVVFDLPGLAAALQGNTVDNSRRSLLYDQFGDPEGVNKYLANSINTLSRRTNAPPVKIKVNPVSTAKSLASRALALASKAKIAQMSNDRNFFQQYDTRRQAVNTRNKTNSTSKTANKTKYI